MIYSIHTFKNLQAKDWIHWSSSVWCKNGNFYFFFWGEEKLAFIHKWLIGSSSLEKHISHRRFVRIPLDISEYSSLFCGHQLVSPLNRASFVWTKRTFLVLYYIFSVCYCFNERLKYKMGKYSILRLFLFFTRRVCLWLGTNVCRLVKICHHTLQLEYEWLEPHLAAIGTAYRAAVDLFTLQDCAWYAYVQPSLFYMSSLEWVQRICSQNIWRFSSYSRSEYPLLQRIKWR